MSDPAAPAEPEAVPVAPMHGLRGSLLLAAVIVAADQATKHWAVNRLSGDRTIDIVWTLRMNLTFNSGMAFSSGTGLGPFIGLVAIVVVVVVVAGVRKNPSKVVAVAAGLVVGGALGNVADRLFRGDGWLHGSVVDFIDFQWFPIFNVADMAVNIGAVLFVLWSLFSKQEARS